jgi:hypothetical protein
MEKAMKTKASVLLVGLEPDIVDYSKSPVPGLTAAKVRAALEADSSKLESLGYSVRSLYVDDGTTAEAVLADTLAADGYDCIMIGAGLRIVPPLFPVVREADQRHPPTRPGFDEDVLQYEPRGYFRCGAAVGLDRVQRRGLTAWQCSLLGVKSASPDDLSSKSQALQEQTKSLRRKRLVGATRRPLQVQRTHSMISSARASTVGGMASPSAFEALRLITSSNLVGCSTGRSAGLAPFRILSI